MSPSQLDATLLVLARTRGHARSLERMIAAYSRTGEHAGLWFGLGLAGLAWARRTAQPRAAHDWSRGLRVVAGAYALNYAIKLTVRRPRPQLPGLEPLTPTVSQLSFPSAHASTSFAAACAYSRVLPRAPLYAAAILFAVSRPYLGVHYPSDVVAGAVLGTALAGAWPP